MHDFECLNNMRVSVSSSNPGLTIFVCWSTSSPGGYQFSRRQRVVCATKEPRVRLDWMRADVCYWGVRKHACCAGSDRGKPYHAGTTPASASQIPLHQYGTAYSCCSPPHVCHIEKHGIFHRCMPVLHAFVHMAPWCGVAFPMSLERSHACRAGITDMRS